MRYDVVTAAAIIALAFAAQAQKNGEIKGSVTQKGANWPQRLEVSPTPTPTTTSEANRAINESGVSAPSGPRKKKPK